MRNKGYCKSWNAQIYKSLRKICHYQQNVPQHYYPLDTLVLDIVNRSGYNLKLKNVTFTSLHFMYLVTQW